MEVTFKATKYGVGIDMGKDEFHACMMAIDGAQRLKIRATRKFSNTPKGCVELMSWVDHHTKDCTLPIQYLMEATGVYSKQLALYLHKQGAYVCVVLAQKTAYYVKALGIKTKTDKVDAQALATMACQQELDAWHPISEAMYKLRQTTHQHTHLHEFKTQLGNQLHALEIGMYQSAMVRKQLIKLIGEIDKQLTECAKQIQKTVEENPEWNGAARAAESGTDLRHQRRGCANRGAGDRGDQ